MSKNPRKWQPMPQALEDLLKRMQDQNKKQIDEATKPVPREEPVN